MNSSLILIVMKSAKLKDESDEFKNLTEVLALGEVNNGF